MGYMRHHAIVVTNCYGDWIVRAHDKATEIFPVVSPVLGSEINGYFSFFVPPDGSKEGWAESDVGDARRERFIAWLESLRYDDGGSPLDWAEVQYGDEEGEDEVIRSSANESEEDEGEG
jgi:hypothetical protein